MHKIWHRRGYGTGCVERLLALQHEKGGPHTDMHDGMGPMHAWPWHCAEPMTSRQLIAIGPVPIANDWG